MTEHPGHIVLVHGSWHGAWCWEPLVPLLEAAGHVVDAVDLPGRSDSRVVARSTFDDFTAAVLARVEAADEPVTLIGHSRSGIIVAQVAEQAPDLIRKAIYLCAFVPRDGQSHVDLSAIPEFRTSLSARYKVSHVDAGTSTFPVEHAHETFCADLSPEQAQAVAARLVPDSLRFGESPVSLSSQGVERVPRAYIECLRDRAIPIEAQRAMYRASGITEVVTLDADHSPFLSRPDELADAVIGLLPSAAPNAG